MNEFKHEKNVVTFKPVYNPPPPKKNAGVCFEAGEKAPGRGGLMKGSLGPCGSVPIVQLFDLVILQLYANEGEQCATMEINSSLVCRVKGRRMRSLPSGALQPAFSLYSEKKGKKKKKKQTNTQHVKCV